MNDEDNPRRPLNSKHLNTRGDQKRKSQEYFSPVALHQLQKMESKDERFGLIVNQNISFIASIAESSFNSGKGDNSLNSIDQFIIGGETNFELEGDDEFAEEDELDYSRLYRQFEQVTRKQSYIQEWDEQSLNPMQTEKQQRKADDHSNSSIIPGNMSDIKQFHQNLSYHQMDRIQQEFIDFVDQNGISKICELGDISCPRQDERIESQKDIDDEVGTLLVNELTFKNMKCPEQPHYNPILSELNVLESQSAVILSRERWVRQQDDKPQKWKKRQLWLLGKMKKILKNPYGSDDSDEL